MSNKKLILLAGALLVVSSVYSKLMCVIYWTEAWEYIDHFIKVVQNEKNYKKRSLLRNIVFNLQRCMFNEIFAIFVLNRSSDAIIQLYIYRAIGVVIMTIYVQYYLQKKTIENDCEIWSVVFMVYTAFFGIWWIQEIVAAQIFTEHNLIYLVVYLFCQAASYLQGDIVEDFVFGDLGVIGIYQNLPWFLIVTIVSLDGFLAHFYYKQSESLRRAPTTYLSSPVVYPSINMMEIILEPCEWHILVFANAVFLFTAVYFQSQWINQVKNPVIATKIQKPILDQTKNKVKVKTN